MTRIQTRKLRAGRPRLKSSSRLILELLETRALLSADAGGMWPLANPTPTNSVIVSFQPTATPAQRQAAIGAVGGYVAKSWSFGEEWIALGQGIDPATAVKVFQADPSVRFAQLDNVLRAKAVPNDPLFSKQYALSNPIGPDIGALGAWNVTTGSQTVVIADTDTGIDYTHPDLYLNIAINQKAIPASIKANLVDTDNDGGYISFRDLNSMNAQGMVITNAQGKPINSPYVSDLNNNGYIDAGDLLKDPRWVDGKTSGTDGLINDLTGWNFVNATYPLAPGTSGTNDPMDDNGHGTMTGGIIGASTNNATGIAGVVWNAQILPLKFLDSTGSGTDAAAIDAIQYAADFGAKVINASWGGPGADPAILSAIQYAGSKGAVFVAAAGNSGTNNDTSPFTPASYASTVNTMISVAATDQNGNLASFSNYGATTVSLGAPGVGIYSTALGGGYAVGDGTSFAAPQVSGVVALVASVMPNATAAQLVQQVLSTTQPLPSLQGKTSTGGLVNAAKAVNVAGPSYSLFPNSATPALQLAGGSPVELGMKFTSSTSGSITGLRFYRIAGDSGPDVGSLWSSTGTLLAQGTYPSGTASGWQTLTFSTPVPISANTTYVTSYHTTGSYADTRNYFTSGVTSGPLTAPSDASSGGNGVYLYGPGGFPNQTYQASNYYTDVIFSPGSTTAPPTITTHTPASGATGVGYSPTVSATFSQPMDPTTINSSTFTLADPTGAFIPSTVTYDSTSQTASLTPNSALKPSTTYTVSISGANSSPNVKNQAGVPLASTQTWTFTTAASASSYSLFPNSATPALQLAGGSPVELGMKFRSSTSGSITGLRFYRIAGDSGPDVGSLWSSTGTLLAQGTYPSGTASGWQTLTFSTPVPISANTTYVTSYHTTGSYADTRNYFTSGVTSGPLTAPSDASSGGNGVYLYGPGGFPNQTYQASNYYTDVIFVG